MHRAQISEIVLDALRAGLIKGARSRPATFQRKFGHTEILGEIELRGIAASHDPKLN
jgi:hypothetical protein